MDEKKRYIYDRYGKAAVDQCWEVIQRSSGTGHFTPDEIIREWERRKREQEGKKADEGWTSEGHLSVTVNATPIWDIEDKKQYGPVPWSDRIPEVSAISITQKFNASNNSKMSVD